jgi:hypothetical protein
LIVDGSNGVELVRDDCRWFGPGADVLARVGTTVRCISGRRQSLEAADGREIVLDWDLHVRVSTNRWNVRDAARELVHLNVRGTAQQSFQTVLREHLEKSTVQEVANDRVAWQHEVQQAMERRLDEAWLDVLLVSVRLERKGDERL